MVAELPTYVGSEQAQGPGVGERRELVGGLGGIDADAFQGGEVDQQIHATVEVGIDQRGAGEVDHRNHHLRHVARARRLLEVAEDLHPAAEGDDQQQRDEQEGLPEQGARQQAGPRRPARCLDRARHQSSPPAGVSGCPPLSSPPFCSSGTKT
jgi:hypothetical protein